MMNTGANTFALAVSFRYSNVSRGRGFVYLWIKGQGGLIFRISVMRFGGVLLLRPLSIPHTVIRRVVIREFIEGVSRLQ